MADDTIYNKSNFIDFQDKNGDGLNDKCDDLISVAEGPKCPPCQPDPNYISPNWRDETEISSWLNQKFCKYQAVIPTTITSLLSADYSDPNEYVESVFESYKSDAIEEFLTNANRRYNDYSIDTLSNVIEFQKYHLEPRPGSYLKLLYSVPYEELNSLPAADEDDEEEDEDEEENSGKTTVEMNADLIQSKMIKFRKAMNLYARLYRVLAYVNKGHLVWQSGPKEGAKWTTTEFDKYGDSGLFPNSTMADVVKDLDGFLNDNDLNIFGVGSLSFGRDRVTKLEFTWNKDYKLIKLKAYSVGCGERPTVFGKRKLKALNRLDSYKDPVAQAYFSQLDKIDSRLSAREAVEWTDFVKEFTKPAVLDTFNWPGDFGDTPETALSCVGDAIAEQGKQLGDDIMDDILGIGDAIAFQFNKQICKKSIGEEFDNLGKLGVMMDPNTGEPKTLFAMATEQAFKELEDDDAVFISLCARLLSGFGGGALGGVNSQHFLDMMYAEGLDRIKLCGLMDLLMDTVGCLLGGLSLEDALSRIIKSALKAMSIDNLGDFFIGLPPDKQAELEALVKKKIESGEIFKDASGGAEEGGMAVVSDTISGKLKWKKPWDQESKDRANKDTSQANVNNHTTSQQSSQLTRRTLAQQFDVSQNDSQQLSPNVVLEAYIGALIEIYGNDLLSLVDMLNKYPGAQMIAKILAMADCPRPPIFDPSFTDFLKDIDLPWCRNSKGLTLPMLFNPFGWIPKLKDITGALFLALIYAIQRAIISIIMRILVKICELLGGAICKALEAVGSVAASLPAIISGRNTFADAIKEAICGEDSDQDNVDDTIAEMFEKLGVGGAALSDKDAVISLTEDLSSFATRSEMFEAFSGNMSPQFAAGAHQIIQNEYPQFADAFPTKGSIGDFMGNVGALMPEDVRKAMRDFADNLPEDDAYPANPSLCATPEQLEDFKDLRCAILEGRASPEQCRQMFDDIQDELGDDLESLGSFMNNPMDPDDLLPPLISAPGCDDGLLPFESDEQKAAASVAIGAGLESLRKDFTEDMLGNGGFLGFGTWGFVNLILADTMGSPLTTHYRKAFNQAKYVDFISEGDSGEDDGKWWQIPDPSATFRQRGNYPTKVAPWLQDQFKDMKADFSSTNTIKDKVTYKKTMDEIASQKIGVDMISIPDLGYGTKFTATTKDGDPAVQITKVARKKDYDIQLKYEDNNKGRKEHDSTPWLYGFNLNIYLAELEKSAPSITQDRPGFGGTTLGGGGNEVTSHMGSYYNPLDTTRIKITELYNPSAGSNADLKNMMTNDEWKDYKKENKGKEDTITDRLFEFVAVENTFDDIDTEQYPNFSDCFEMKRTYIPQIVLFKELIEQNNNGEAPSETNLRNFYDTFMGEMFELFASEIASNDAAFKYGAKYDDLTMLDAEYLVRAGQTDSPAGTLYKDATIDGDKLTNDDMILGVSRNQYELGEDDARVFYLDPTTYGGSYKNPAVHIKPLKNEGWLGFVDVLFPDYSPCKPRSTDLVDFGEIQKEVSSTYNSIPEDQRLKSDPDCVTEAPYNRILERPGKANIQGLIKAACRIYGTVHIMKSMATFTTFKPDFYNVYSAIYAQYIVEVMEKSFRDSQKAFWEFFNPFKDDEFWYAFLEQAVQTYGRLVDDGQIIDPPEAVLQALLRINDAQEIYNYPQRSDLKEAKEVDEVSFFQTLKGYRSEKSFEFVQATEEDAKIVLKEMVLVELQAMGEILTENLKDVGMAPKYTNLAYYLFQNMCQGASDLDLDKELTETPTSLPIEGEEHFTNGAELSDPDGKEYVGYYHVHEDEDGNIIYMAGEFHTTEGHDELNPFANKMIVEIGDIVEYGTTSHNLGDTEKPFILEKYISINGQKYNPTTAINSIKSANDINLNVSDVYPGDIRLVYPLATAFDRGASRLDRPVENENVAPIGVEGDLGIRYGVQLSIGINGQKYLLADGEMGAIDTKIGQIAPLEANSKLLLCVINKLKEDDRFKIVNDYIFSSKKIVSILAIYNDLGFLASIGEKTVEDGDTLRNLDSDFGEPNFDTKPGAKVSFSSDFKASYEGNDKWASHGDRNQPWTLFVTTWDEWDQTLLRNSKARIKKLFKQDYYSRDFNPAEAEPPNFAKIIGGNLKASLKPPAGARILPRLTRRNLVSNPFNSKGELCTKSD
jgi:hypothetical protein